MDMTTLFLPFDPRATISRYYRVLPHWAQESATYFVTFRTADSIPQSKLHRLVREKEHWLRQHPRPWSCLEEIQYLRLFEGRIQRWLDRSFGECVLRVPEIASIVAASLRHFDLKRYALDEFAVMPNHVHALVQPWNNHGLRRILHSWKSYTANAVNRRLGRSGPLWLKESFDHIVRNADHLQRFRRYIRRNPQAAGLSPGEFVLGKGSGLSLGPVE